VLNLHNNNQIPNFIEIRQVVVKLFRASKRTGMPKLTAAARHFANAPKKNKLSNTPATSFCTFLQNVRKHLQDYETRPTKCKQAPLSMESLVEHCRTAKQSWIR
jgi:hypothetical protein